ncbi:uncharacterized protein LOC144665377 [Oculina patagonica]
MQSNENFFTSFSYEKEIERAKWYKNGPGNVYWIKTFPDEEVLIKVLSWVDMPISAEMYMEMMHPRNQDKRDKWDRAFLDQEILETYSDNQGVVKFMRSPSSFPLSDRSFVLFCPPTKEIDWFGKRAFIQVQKNAWHPSKPEGADGLVRPTNGGNLSVIIPDETQPNVACRLFSLSQNNYNGCLPKKHIERILGRKVPASFNQMLASMIEGYKKYFKEN